MSDIAMTAALEHFPSSGWAKPTSKKYAESLGALSSFTDTEVIDALKSLKRTVVRSNVTVDEIIGEIRRLRRRSDLVQQAAKDALDEDEVKRERADIARMLHLASRDEIAAGVAHARQVGVLSPDPLPPNIEDWTDYARGIVWAAMDQQGVFK
jgi:hypothetical protein